MKNKGSAEKCIEELLSNGQRWTVNEIVIETGYSYYTVKQAVYILRKRGVTIKREWSFLMRLPERTQHAATTIG